MIIRWLVFLMALAACEQFGTTIVELSKCRSRACLQQVEKHSQDVLKIGWKPISVWPEKLKKIN